LVAPAAWLKQQTNYGNKRTDRQTDVQYCCVKQGRVSINIEITSKVRSDIINNCANGKLFSTSYLQCACPYVAPFADTYDLYMTSNDPD